MSQGAPPPRVCAPGLPLSLHQLSENRFVEEQVRHQFFELAVFLCQGFEAFDRLFLGPAEFLLPEVIGGRADRQLFADSFHALASAGRVGASRRFLMISSGVCRLRFMRGESGAAAPLSLIAHGSSSGEQATGQCQSV